MHAGELVAYGVEPIHVQVSGISEFPLSFSLLGPQGECQGAIWEFDW